jgi:hypothetical protein
MAQAVRSTVTSNSIGSVFTVTDNFDGVIYGNFGGGVAWLEKSQDGVNGWGEVDISPYGPELDRVVKVNRTYHFHVVNSGTNSYRLVVSGAVSPSVVVATNQA